MLDIAPGWLIAGRYRLVAQIAKGGMGTVWAADDEKLRRKVAIKVLHPKWGTADDARVRFEREAMAVAQLNCPHVVQIYDYGVVDGSPFIAMELMDGEDLQAKLKRERRMSLADTYSVIWQTAKALGVAHGAGIVHRDLKPGNIFLSRRHDDVTVKVLDFGVAKLVEQEEAGADEERTREGVIVGTPHYMSPEQARGIPGTIDHRADLWSLGVIAYRALTGKLPFRGRTGTDVIVALLTRRGYKPATEVAPDLPREFNAFFTRALSHERDKRFQSAKDMAAALAYLSDCSMPSMRLPDPAVAMFNDLMIEDAPISTIDTGAIRRRIAMPDLPHDTMSSLTDSSIGGRINSETPVPRSGSLPGLQIDSRPPPRPKQRKLYLFAAIALLGLAGYLGHGALRYGVLNQQPVAAPATPVVEEPPPTSAHGQLPTSAASVPAPLASASAAPASAETAPDAGVKPLAPRRARPVIGAHPPKPPPPPATTATKAADPFSERL